jgi:KDO2-lipid IV(A) lauroyltransferase
MAVLAYWGVRVGCATGRRLIALLPPSLCFKLADRLADSAFFLLPRLRQRALDNLAMALGRELGPAARERIARDSWRNFARAVVEVTLAMGVAEARWRERVAIEGREHLDAALRRGRGAIALSAHLGNFFLLGSRLAVEGYPVQVLVRPAADPRIADLCDRYRLEIGQRTIRARPRRAAARALIAALRENQVVVVIADEYRSKGVGVRFFGVRAMAKRGPVTLALRTGAAVLPLYMVRERGGLRLIIEPELEFARTGETREDVRANVGVVSGWLERLVRRYPEQWNWSLVRWREAAGAEPAAREAPQAAAG